MASSVQIRLFTEQADYRVGEEAISVPSDAQVDQLNALVHLLLTHRDAESGEASAALSRTRLDAVLFDFLINSTVLLRQPLIESIAAHGFSAENIIPIEYVVKQRAPAPRAELSLSDWVGCCHILPANAQHASDAGERLVLVGTYDNAISIISVTGNGRNILRRVHTGPIKAVRWLPKTIENAELGAGFLSASHDQTVMLWLRSVKDMDAAGDFTAAESADVRSTQALDQSTFEPSQIFRGHAGSVDCLSVSAADATKFCTGSWDTMLKIWSTDQKTVSVADDVENDEHNFSGQRTAKRRKADPNSTKSSGFVNGNIEAVSSHVAVRVPLLTLDGHTQPISACKWFTDNEIVTAGWDHTVRVWDAERGGVKNKLVGPTTFFALDVQNGLGSTSNLIITGSADRFCRLWDLRSQEGTIVKASYGSHKNWIVGCKWSPRNAQHFLTASYDHLAKLWDLRSTRVPLYDIEGHTGNVLACDWSEPDGNFIVTGGADSQLKVFTVPAEFGGTE